MRANEPLPVNSCDAPKGARRLFLFGFRAEVLRSRIAHDCFRKRANREFRYVEGHHVFPYVLCAGRPTRVVGTRRRDAEGLFEDVADVHVAFHDNDAGTGLLWAHEREVAHGKRPVVRPYAIGDCDVGLVVRVRHGSRPSLV